MDEKELRKFQNDAPQRDSLKSFMLATLQTMAGDKAMKGEPVTGFPEAKILIDTVFTKLDELNSKK